MTQLLDRPPAHPSSPASKRTVVAVVVLVAALVGALSIFDWPWPSRTPTVPRAPSAAADLSWLPAADVLGRPIDPGSLATSKVVLVKTASWCMPCLDADVLGSVTGRAGSSTATRYVVLLVNETAESARAVAQKYSTSNLQFVSGSLSDGEGSMPQAFSDGVPAVAIVPASGGVEPTARTGADATLGLIATS